MCHLITVTQSTRASRALVVIRNCVSAAKLLIDSEEYALLDVTSEHNRLELTSPCGSSGSPLHRLRPGDSQDR